MARPEVRREFAHWLALDRRTKLAFGLPTTEADFGRDKGVNTRTLRRWKDDPEFQAVVEQRKVELANEVLPNSAVAAVGGPRPHTDARSRARLATPKEATPADDPARTGDLTPGEVSYNQAKDTLWTMAAGGDMRAADLALKYWGKAYIEAEQAEVTTFADMSDEELLTELVNLAGPENIAAVLAEL